MSRRASIDARYFGVKVPNWVATRFASSLAAVTALVVMPSTRYLSLQSNSVSPLGTTLTHSAPFNLSSMPHFDAVFPGSVKAVRERGLDAAVETKLLADNALAFYGDRLRRLVEPVLKEA